MPIPYEREIMRIAILFSLLAVQLLGCGSSQQFPAVPPDLQRESVPHQIIDMTAEHFHFTPELLHVKQGTFVTLHIKALDGTHGFSLGAFGIDETIPEQETKTVEFFAGKKGEYGFKCSHFCGIGHLGMTGKVIVE
jgi:heme/copper-type cytochrome/quinol oxidase subunit 2